MKKIYLFLTLALAWALTACNDDGVDDILEAPANSQVIFGQFSPTLGLDVNLNVDFFYGNTTTQNARQGFATIVGRQPTPGVPFRVALQPAPGTTQGTEVITGSPTIQGRNTYTALVCNTDGTNLQPNAPVSMMFMEDDLSPAPAGSTKIRFIHLAVGAPAVDVYLVPASGDPVVIRNIAYGQTTGGNVSLQAGQVSAITAVNFTQIPAATYRIDVRPAGAPDTDTPVLTVNNVNLTPRQDTSGFFQAFTIVANGFLAQPAGITNRALRATVINHANSFNL